MPATHNNRASHGLIARLNGKATQSQAKPCERSAAGWARDSGPGCVCGASGRCCGPPAWRQGLQGKGPALSAWAARANRHVPLPLLARFGPEKLSRVMPFLFPGGLVLLLSVRIRVIQPKRKRAGVSGPRKFPGRITGFMGVTFRYNYIREKSGARFSSCSDRPGRDESPTVPAKEHGHACVVQTT